MVAIQNLLFAVVAGSAIVEAGGLVKMVTGRDLEQRDFESLEQRDFESLEQRDFESVEQRDLDIRGTNNIWAREAPKHAAPEHKAGAAAGHKGTPQATQQHDQKIDPAVTAAFQGCVKGIAANIKKNKSNGTKVKTVGKNVHIITNFPKICETEALAYKKTHGKVIKKVTSTEIELFDAPKAIINALDG